MRKILSILILAMAFSLFSGCAPMTPQQQMAWQDFWQNCNSNYQRELDRQAYGRQPVIITHQKNNYWQEQRARQEYFNSLGK